MTAVGVRRAKAALSSGCKPHPATLQPEAIGAVMEVTKWLKPSISVSRIGGSASVQAATRVNAEQASKRTMCREMQTHVGEVLHQIGAVVGRLLLSVGNVGG